MEISGAAFSDQGPQEATRSNGSSYRSQDDASSGQGEASQRSEVITPASQDVLNLLKKHKWEARAGWVD